MRFKKQRLVLSASVMTAGVALASVGVPIATATASASPQKVLGIVALIANDALNIQTINGAKAVAKANGWTVKVTDTQGSSQKANSAMITFATSHVTAMYVLAYAPSSIGAGLAAANAAGIPVAEWGSAPKTKGIVSTVNYEAVAQAEVNALVKDVPKPASILELNFSGGALCITDGQVYAKTVNLPSSGYTIKSVQIDGANAVSSGQNFTAAWLATHPKGSGKLAILSSWDVPTTGAVAALQAAGRKDVKVYSINGESQTLALVKSGWETETTRPSAYQEGQQSMTNILAYLKASKSAQAKWVAPVIAKPVTVITKANLAAFLKANPGAM
jgi:ribose transport system substrate-binding protein